MNKKKNKTGSVPFFKYLAFVVGVVSIIMLGLFKFIDVLPGEYFLVLCILIGLIDIILIILILKRGMKKRIVGTILSLLYLVVMILAIVYELNTINFLKKLGYTNFKTENYSIIVLNDSKYNEIKDLTKKEIGSLLFNTEGLKDAKGKINKVINVNYKEYEEIGDLLEDFLNNRVDAMLVENSILGVLEEGNEKLHEKYRIIYDFSVEVQTEDIAKNVNITKESFNIYISGIDTYGAVNSVARSDVNMVMSINPKTHKILITSIPRDYYVELGSKNGKDKLTHAGVYGAEESVKTIEKLLDIKINYYVKVNFSSVIKIVDTLGGVNVYSKNSFTSIDGVHFNEGYNYLNGKDALSFVRERKAFSGGDRVRVENQAALVEALVDKVTSPAIITKYSSLLNTLGDSFITNMDTDSITEFIKMQIDEAPSWKFQNISLNGTDHMDYTYTYGHQKLYVMIPDNETVINAKSKIKGILSE